MDDSPMTLVFPSTTELCSGWVSLEKMDDSPMTLVFPSTTVHDIPYEIIDKIFGHVGVRDVGRCMMVSKQWYSIGSKMKINELIFKNTNKYHAYYNKWCTKELFDDNKMINNLHLSKPLPMNTAFLRRLALYDNDSHDFQLIHLNKFVHLQHLEINYFDKQSQLGITFLNLPNLKILQCQGIDCNLVFNTPTLTAVYIHYSKNVRFRNLPTLELCEYETWYNDVDTYSRIKNVEVFRMQYNMNFHVIPFALRHFDKLEEVHWEYNLLANSIEREYFQEWLDIISEERKNLNKRNVKIYLFGILLEDDKALDDYGFENIKHLYIR